MPALNASLDYPKMIKLNKILKYKKKNTSLFYKKSFKDFVDIDVPNEINDSK